MPDTTRILALNAGSSSLKFALYEMGASRKRLLTGKAERIATAADAGTAAERILDWLGAQGDGGHLDAIGHRCVFGGPGRVKPAWLDAELLDSLSGFVGQDPEYMPNTLAVIEAARERHPGLAQYVCFDTAFHATMPRLARLYPLPPDLEAEGVVRHGFHGLSCESVLQELARQVRPETVAGRLVIAHLGSSCSLTAVRNGRSVDTTMGISPAGGIMMGTRSGDLDPGVYQYLARQRHLSPDGIDELVNRRSGLAGMSGLGADMRDLLAAERASPRAADAVGLFCYQCRKAVGGLAAALGGLDELVFTGGIGENCPAVRARICEGLLHLGVALDAVLNAEPSGVVSGAGSLVRVRVIKTREERQIAEHGAALIRQREGVPA